jgi:FkbM family methyltransferase
MQPRVKAIARRLTPHPIYRRYRQRKIAAVIENFTPREVTHVYGGHSLRIRLADPLARGWYDHDWEESAVIAFLREHGVLAPGATVFDVGAHQAIVALILARTVGDGGRVIAVEAEPHNARIAAANRDLNDAGNLTVIHAAGAASAGTIHFAEGLNGQVDERTASGNVVVPAITVDDLAREYGTPDLVFIDVEGYEEQVLKGAADTLAGAATSFLVEVHEELAAYGGSAAALAQRFLGFDRYVTLDEFEPLVALADSPPADRFFIVAIPPGAQPREVRG